MPHEFTKKKKSFVLKCYLLLFRATTMNHFLIKLWCAIKSGFSMTIRSDQLSVWTKKLQSTCQSQTCTKKRSQVTAWWFSVGMIHYSFLNLSETITPEKYAQKLMRCTENCNACSWHWSTARAQFFPMTIPNCTLHIPHSESLTNWATKFCLICHIQLSCCQPTTTYSSIWTTFL